MFISARGLRFDAVDRQDDRESLVRYLEGLHALTDVRAYKSRTLDRLQLSTGVTVLDVGCGAGEDSLALAHAVGSTGRVLAVDLSQTMLREVHQKRTKRTSSVATHGDDSEPATAPAAIDATCASVLALPFENASVDRCRADRVLQHVSDAARAIGEMTRVLRPGGILLVCDTDWDTLVVDHPDRDTTRAVLRWCAQAMTNGAIGRALARHCLDAGLRNVGVDAMTMIFRDLELADAVVGLRRAVLALAQHPEADLDALASWLTELEDLQRRGRCFCAVTGFAAWGTR
jgi:ubiquinone/menaquinone biosynthesis C-methylase UbiE